MVPPQHASPSPAERPASGVCDPPAGPLRIAYMTREYPPCVYGGAGDGHDLLAAVARVRRASGNDWREIRMRVPA